MKKNQWGLYRSSVRQFSIRVPLGWSVTELENQLEIQSGVADVSVIISSFLKSTRGPIDVVAQLRRFLETAKVEADVQIKEANNRKALVEYRDIDGAMWYVVVQAQQQRFLLITCNTATGSGSQNFRIGHRVVESIAFDPPGKNYRKQDGSNK